MNTDRNTGASSAAVAGVIRDFLRTIQCSSITAGSFRAKGLAAVLIAVSVLMYGVQILLHLMGKAM